VSVDFLHDGDPAAPGLLLAHGAGAGMDSAWLARMASLLAGHGLHVIRFEFPYMARRRDEGTRRPPDRQPVLLEAIRAAHAGAGRPPILAGKSMGGRMMSLVADELGAAALICFGFPFHAPGRLPGDRISHLATLQTPTLILQGTRDPFGKPDEVAAYALSNAIQVDWLDDADHDFRTPKGSDRTSTQTLDHAAAIAAEFATDHARG